MDCAWDMHGSCMNHAQNIHKLGTEGNDVLNIHGVDMYGLYIESSLFWPVLARSGLFWPILAHPGPCPFWRILAS